MKHRSTSFPAILLAARACRANTSTLRRIIFLAAASLTLLPGARGQTTPVVTMLYNFMGNGSDGVLPQAGLVQGSDGNFYGTTNSGGRIGV